MPSRLARSPKLHPVALLAFIILLLASACGKFRAPPAALTPQCELDGRQRERVAALLAEGKLDRAVRVIGRADALCPESAHESSVALVVTLAALGRHADALATAERLEADGKASPQDLAAARAARAIATEVHKTFPDTDETDEAKKRMRELFDKASAAHDAGDWGKAKEQFLVAWREGRTNGQALFGAGLAAKRMGDKAQAQRLFDMATVELEAKVGQPVRLDTPDGPPGLGSIAWSPSGKLLAVATYLRVSVIEVATLHETMRFDAPNKDIAVVAFSPDGKTLAACPGRGEVLHLWEIDSGAERKLVAERSSREARTGTWCHSVAWSPDGKSLATALETSVQLWDVASGKAIRKLDGHSDQVESVAWSPDGKMLASGSHDHMVRLWDVASSKEIGKLEQYKSLQWLYGDGIGGEARYPVAWSPDGKTLACGSGHATVALWDVASRKKVRELEGHEGAVMWIAWSPDGKTLASSSRDVTMRLWDIASGYEIRKIAQGEAGAGAALGVLFSVAWSPDGKTIASGSSDLTLRLWTLDSGRPRTVHPHQDPIYSVAWSPDGKTLALGSHDNTVRTWDLDSGTAFRALKGHAGRGAWSPDGKTLASGAHGNTVRLWDVASGKEIRKLEGHAGRVTSVAWSPDGKMLASGSDDNTVRLWELASGKEIRKLEGPRNSNPDAIAWSPDGKTLASASGYKTVRLWDVASGEEIRKLEGHTGYVKAVAWSPDGKTLASGSDHAVHLWDVASGQEPRKLEGHTRTVTSVAWSPDGKTLASGSEDTTVRLWDIASGEELRKLEGHTSAVTSVAWRPDGKTLVSGSEHDTAVRFWSTSAGGRGYTGAVSAIAYPVRGTDAAYAFTAGADPRYEFFGEAARDIAVCRVGYLSFPLDLCEERFVVPGLLRMVMAADSSYLEP
jgi:WD40 repeat protein